MSRARNEWDVGLLMPDSGPRTPDFLLWTTETRKELTAWLEFYQELGIEGFYRREPGTVGTPPSLEAARPAQPVGGTSAETSSRARAGSCGHASRADARYRRSRPRTPDSGLRTHPPPAGSLLQSV